MSSITLTPRTFQILRNFSTINKSLVFKKGSTLATVSPAKTILAKANVEETFTRDFAIYDLSKFLSVLSLFENPELTFTDKHVTISSGSRRVNYVYTDISLFTGGDKIDPYIKEPKFPTSDVEITLTQDIFTDVKKAGAVLKLPEIVIIGDGSSVAVEAVDTANPTTDVYAVDVGETDKNFKFVFKKDNLSLAQGDYLVQISQKKISKFVGDNIQYFIAVEDNSTFGK